jgi:hypothetical protein
MNGGYEDPPAADEQEVAPPEWRDGPPSGTRVVRAVFVLVLMIVVGILVLPAATRSPRLPALTAATKHHQTAPPTTTTTQPSTTTTVPTVSASSIAVLVANGTATSHGAGDVRTWLGQKGFNITSIPAYDTTTPQTSDAIYYVNSGTAQMADQVAAALSLTGSVVQAAGSKPPVSTITGADVVVVLGNDLANRANAGTLGSPPSSADQTTPTTS